MIGATTQIKVLCGAYRSKVDDSLRGHRASHEANKLQLGTVLCNSLHGAISDLDNRIEWNRIEWQEEERIYISNPFNKHSFLDNENNCRNYFWFMFSLQITSFISFFHSIQF